MKKTNQYLIKIFSKLYLLSEIMAIYSRMNNWQNWLLPIIYIVKKQIFLDGIKKQDQVNGFIQDYVNGLNLGFMNTIPDSPTDKFVKSKSNECCYQIFYNLFIIYQIIVEQNLNALLISTFFLGQVSSYGLCISLRYQSYENIKAILINIAESTIFSSLVMILLVHLIVFSSFYCFELIIINSLILLFSNKRLILIYPSKIAYLILIGYSQIRLRVQNLELLQLYQYQNSLIQMGQYKMCKVIILELIVVNYLLGDNISPLYQISLILFILFIPTFIQIYYQNKNYINYLNYVKISIENNNIQSFEDAYTINLHKQYEQNMTECWYYFNNLSTENEQLALKRVLGNKRQIFKIFSQQIPYENYFVHHYIKNQKINIEISINNYKYLDLVFQTLVESKQYLKYKIKIIFYHNLGMYTQYLIMKYYELTSVSENFKFQIGDGGRSTSPFQYNIYKCIILQNIVFQNLIKPKLTINPSQVFVDLYFQY